MEHTNTYSIPIGGRNGAVGTPPVDRDTGGLTGFGLGGSLRSLGTGFPVEEKPTK